MSIFFSIVLIMATLTFLAYFDASLLLWTGFTAIALGIVTVVVSDAWIFKFILWLIAAIAFIPLYLGDFRRRFIIKPILAFYRKAMPKISETEQQAIDAGDVSWEQQLFSGKPDWDELLSYPEATLTEQEQIFMDGPVAILCSMIDDWKITHEDADLDQGIWDYLKSEGFFSLLIPTKFGGKGFSELAHSAVLVKVAGYSVTVASTITVPNSLGPAELILKYGTDEQKDYYLPRLAKGIDVPCFALTGPQAGSDAGSIPDYGVICHGHYKGKDTLGIKLTFDKRYITLAPVATVIGLAFKLYDPDHLLGSTVNYGITCALVPRDLPGINIGRRHFPLNVPFQNGPIQGKNVFIPLDSIIGGMERAGQGWRMLMECLSAGRAISLPSNAVGGAKMAVATTGAYARIRRQFNVSIGQFEGVGEKLGEMAGWTYIMDAARLFTASLVAQDLEPAIPSAIIKYHVTELGRMVQNHAMDVHGGKGICLGPNNYLGRGYQGVPIGITVEGANILTRCLIIFGQGAIRCHPYLLKEMQIAQSEDEVQALVEFDKTLLDHLRHVANRKARAFVMGLTHSLFVTAPKSSMKRYYQHFSRFSSAYAFLVDSMTIFLGSQLKRRELLSGRLADILSYLYLGSSVLKQYSNQGEPQADEPVVQWACDYLLYQIQIAMKEITQNLPFPIIGSLMSIVLFPLGKRFKYPTDKLTLSVASSILNQSETRERLMQGMDLSCHPRHPSYQLEKLFAKIEVLEHYEKQILPTVKMDNAFCLDDAEKLQLAHEQKLISGEDQKILSGLLKLRKTILQVDDFAAEALCVKKPTPQTLQQI